MKRTKMNLTKGPISTMVPKLWPCLMCLMLGAGPEGTTSSKPGGAAPASVENRVTEADLTTITLTPLAADRLAIKTVESREGRLNRRRFYGGEAMAPPDRAIQLVAPFAGTIVVGDDGPIPRTGSSLKKGDVILRLQPSVMAEREVLAPSERIALARAAADFEAAQAQAEGEVNAARVQLEAAEVRLDRAQRLRDQNATSVRQLDEAKAEHELAQARLEAAQAKVAAWISASQGMHADPRLSLELLAPFDGVLMDLAVVPGEIIAANSPVARIVSASPLWIRVRTYVGELDDMDPNGVVRLGSLNGRPQPDMPAIERIAGTPTADPVSSAVDLYFLFENSEAAVRPGQRVGVWIPLSETTDGIVVPWSAILYDHHGGAWVYEQLQPRQFSRRRVQLDAVKDGHALLSRGLRAGARIVTDGAAELFGVEFGAGK